MELPLASIAFCLASRFPPVKLPSLCSEGILQVETQNPEALVLGIIRRPTNLDEAQDKAINTRRHQENMLLKIYGICK